jgi:hypothetical protein
MSVNNDCNVRAPVLRVRPQVRSHCAAESEVGVDSSRGPVGVRFSSGLDPRNCLMEAKPKLLLFFAAMKALQNAELSGKYAWASSLIGGALR